MAGDLFNVALYLKAKTENELIKAQIEQNLKDGVRHKYFDIQRSGKFWYAWYYADASKIVRQKVNNAVSGNS